MTTKGSTNRSEYLRKNSRLFVALGVGVFIVLIFLIIVYLPAYLFELRRQRTKFMLDNSTSALGDAQWRKDHDEVLHALDNISSKDTFIPVVTRESVLKNGTTVIIVKALSNHSVPSAFTLVMTDGETESHPVSNEIQEISNNILVGYLLYENEIYPNPKTIRSASVKEIIITFADDHAAMTVPVGTHADWK